MHWVLAVETHVLGFVERSHADRVDLKELQAFVASERAELEQIEAYINGSGERAARIYYIQGMLLGIVPLIAVGFLAAFLISLFDALDVHDEGIRAFYGCAVAGAAGAIVSVLSRMGSKKDNFAIDHEIPRRGLYLLGLVSADRGRDLRGRDVLPRLDPAAPDRAGDEDASPSTSPSPSWPGSASAGRASSSTERRASSAASAREARGHGRRRAGVGPQRGARRRRRSCPSPSREGRSAWPPTPTSQSPPDDVATRVAALRARPR